MLLMFSAYVASLISANRPSGLRHLSTTGPQVEPEARPPGCPDRVVEMLPRSETAELVAAYSTANKQIILCRGNSGQVYYYGEYTGQPDTGLAFPAEETPYGYVALNGSYAYEVRGNEVIITRNGDQIGREDLTTLQPVP
ncbi:hypothetical protein [Streptosporangium sp. KLBMP 9127]|nr:hypothetical protein [Streptosporangium sp. KLBMP 9127]